MLEVKDKFSVVVPVLNSKNLLRSCLDSILAAMERYGDSELIVLDNGSNDGSYEILLNEYGSRARIQQVCGVPVGALRNRGAALAEGEFVVFIDSDCVIVPHYFEQALNVLRETGADATGSEPALREKSHWIEETWYRVHTPTHDGPVKFIPSGNLVVRRQAFLAIGGFDEKMISCEDMDLGARLNKAGFKVFQSHSLRTFHLGGDKSLRVFFLKSAWRTMGMFGMFKNNPLFKPVLTLVTHLLLCMLAVANLFNPHLTLIARFSLFVLLVNLAPVLAILYRVRQLRRLYSPAKSLLLYHVYFLAQAYGMWRAMIALGKSVENKHAKSVRLRGSARSRP